MRFFRRLRNTICQHLKNIWFWNSNHTQKQQSELFGGLLKEGLLEHKIDEHDTKLIQKLMPWNPDLKSLLDPDYPPNNDKPDDKLDENDEIEHKN